MPPKPAPSQVFQAKALRPMGEVLVDTSRRDLIVVADADYKGDGGLLVAGRE